MDNKEIIQQNETEEINQAEVVDKNQSDVEKNEIEISPVESNTEISEQSENLSESEESVTENLQTDNAETEEISENEENVSYETQETEQSESVQETRKQKSTIQIFFENLYYKLSYTPALGFVCIMSIVSFLGLIFFINTRKLHEANLDVANSCLIMQFFFGAMLILFATLFIVSIALNIIRRKQGKR